MRKNRLYLSPPHLNGCELENVKGAFEKNWIAPVGPDIDAFEQDFCTYTGAKHALALSSGTAAIHLALLVSGLKTGDVVFCSTFTFAGSAFPIRYIGAEPVFIDSESESWNIDPEQLRTAIKKELKKGKRLGAVIVVHLYGQSANLNDLKNICDEFNISLIEDSAESLGAYNRTMHTGTIGELGVFSFNGNKIITSSGGGMLVGKDKSKIDMARYLSTQARESLSHYEHTMVGYNYRMSNICAAIGRGQLSVIEKRIRRRRQVYDSYKEKLDGIGGIRFMPRDRFGRGNCWLTCLEDTGEATPECIRLALEKENIESRPLWKPMHLQPVFASATAYCNGTSEKLFKKGLCLPSGTAMTIDDINKVTEIIKEVFRK
ncbi:MAG: aminotransferase class I/II-fold pyridoxal phosphate-dependent enzyme [Candidatus Latescibacteria bacterium]|nr:aminotransferase class I/II-fold pyridoxal phosphate-dependent enzyme [Candidatus Latescibacterota bacterium]